MEVILLEKIHKLGNLGDKVKVKPGFGRNYLIPVGKAVAATPENLKKFEEARAELEQAQADALQKAQARAEALNGTTVTINAKAGAEGKLFGSVGTQDIADVVTAAGNEVSKKEVLLPNGPLRVVGEHSVELRLHADVEAAITVVIVAEAEQGAV